MRHKGTRSNESLSVNNCEPMIVMHHKRFVGFKYIFESFCRLVWIICIEISCKSIVMKYLSIYKIIDNFPWIFDCLTNLCGWLLRLFSDVPQKNGTVVKTGNSGEF